MGRSDQTEHRLRTHQLTGGGRDKLGECIEGRRDSYSVQDTAVHGYFDGDLMGAMVSFKTRLQHRRYPSSSPSSKHGKCLPRMVPPPSPARAQRPGL